MINGVYKCTSSSLLFEYKAETVWIGWLRRIHKAETEKTILPATETSAANKAREITKNIVRFK